MSTGRKVGGIILIVIGAIMASLGILVAVVFFGIKGAANEVGMEELLDRIVAEKMDELDGNVLRTVGTITEIDTEGSVTRLQYFAESDGKYHPIEMYLVADGFQVGDTVTVYYSEKDPSKFIVPELYAAVTDVMSGAFTVIGSVAAVVGAIGAILLIVGIVMVAGKKKAKI